MFFQNYEIPKMLLTQIQNSAQNVYIVTHGSCDLLKYRYEIFIREIICEIDMFMHTFMYCIYNIII